ncbi:hypothetical protein ACIA8O_14755 [Kitasatospora sp. NPDC051853]|uniref:hypothetical protein n=1 Tax=Kitasatospora sp. NPDC051853 TaxID=3364058 RepID=UPI0037AF5E84
MKHTTRHAKGVIHVYDLTTGPGELTGVATFTPVAGDEPVSSSVSSDLRRLCYTTLDAVVCVSAGGAELWRRPLEPLPLRNYVRSPSCELAPDQRTLWVFRPDAMGGHGLPDHWEVLDAETGELLDRAGLDTTAHGGSQYFHPADGHVLLEVGEGQDGVITFRGALVDGRLEVFRYPWHDRCLIELSPDGTQFMTVAHDQTDVTFHRYPGGEELLTLTVDAFEPVLEEAVVEWNGGYLTDSTAVVTIAGEDEETEEEWHRDHLVDLTTGAVSPFPSGSTHSYDVTPLGDGSWLLDGPVRRCGPA